MLISFLFSFAFHFSFFTAICKVSTDNHFDFLHFFSMQLLFNVSDQIRSVTQLCPTLCNPMNRSTPGLPVQHQLLELLRLTSIESVMPSSHLILCRPLLLLPPIPPSIRVFSNESSLRMRWPNTGVSALASFLPKKSQG